MRLWRYCIAGFLFNWLVFVFWTVVPILAVRQYGASNTEIALLQTASTVFYVLNSLYIGRLSDRVSRSKLARLACVGALVSCALTVWAGSLTALFLVVPLMGIAGSIYWPSIQGAVGEEAGPDEVEKAIGWFNVSWSTGKTLGFIVAGWLMTQSNSLALWIAAASALPVIFLYPGDRPRKEHGPHLSAGPDRPAFLAMGYVANFLAFGIGAIFQGQFFKYVEQLKLGGSLGTQTFFGVVLGALYGTQTLLFVVLQRGAGWTYRRSLLYGAQLVCGAAAVAVSLTTNSGALVAAGALVGIGLGFANASSIYYSLHGPADHGKYAGLHEAVLGSGSILIPLASGRLADLSGDLRTPYWLAGAATLAAIVVQEVLYRRRASSSSNRSILKSAPSSSPGLK
jgi:MFS family permease